MTNELLIHRLRTWPVGDIGRQAATEIESLAEDKRKLLHALTLITDETGPAARRIAKEALAMVKP
jgi:hypothetical protein